MTWASFLILLIAYAVAVVFFTTLDHVAAIMFLGGVLAVNTERGCMQRRISRGEKP